MKRIAVALLAVLLIMPSAYAVSTGASGAILMDAESGRILYGHHIHQPRLIASTTKLMTALVAVEHCHDPDAEITVQPGWIGAEGSSIYLQAGETVTFRELLYGMLLHSGNDAAVAVACLVAGSEEAFAALMNEKARELGMVNSSFANASGLDQQGHYSTPYDMALLAAACLQEPLVADACSSARAAVGSRTFVNHNKLLQRYEGCIGMKTGYTRRAGRTLVSAVRRNGRILICVTLNDGDDWKDHEELYDYGFAHWSTQTLCAAGDRYGVLPVEGSLLPSVELVAVQTVSYPLAEGEYPLITVELPAVCLAPIEKGRALGRAVWTLDGAVIGQTELAAAVSCGYDRAGKPDSLIERLRALLNR